MNVDIELNLVMIEDGNLGWELAFLNSNDKKNLLDYINTIEEVFKHKEVSNNNWPRLRQLKFMEG